MKGVLKTADKRIYLVQTEDGRFSVIDVRNENKTGLAPMETLLFAAAACSAIDVQAILEKKRYEIKEIKIEIEGKRRDEYPKIWEEIKYTYVVKGNGIKSKDVEKAIKLSLEKYCSATITLVKAGAKLTWDYRVEEG